jgi:hypothetical protein
MTALSQLMGKSLTTKAAVSKGTHTGKRLNSLAVFLRDLHVISTRLRQLLQAFVVESVFPER